MDTHTYGYALEDRYINISNWLLVSAKGGFSNLRNVIEYSLEKCCVEMTTLYALGGDYVTFRNHTPVLIREEAHGTLYPEAYLRLF